MICLINILLSPIPQEHKQEFVYKGLFPEKVEIGKTSLRCNAEITEQTIIVRNGLQVKSDCFKFGSHVALSQVFFFTFHYYKVSKKEMKNSFPRSVRWIQ